MADITQDPVAFFTDLRNKPQDQPGQKDPSISDPSISSPSMDAAVGGDFDASKDTAVPNPAPMRKGDYSTDYNTVLSPDEQVEYNKYKSSLGERGNDSDYDLQGYWLKYGRNEQPKVEGTHFTDEFKKPNHKTFSDQSIYDKQKDKDGNEIKGGKWYGDTSYLPPASVLSDPARMRELQEYMQGPAEKGKVKVLTAAPTPKITEDPTDFFNQLRRGSTDEERKANDANKEAENAWFNSLYKFPADQPLPEDYYNRVRADKNPENIKKYIQMGIKPSDEQLIILHNKERGDSVAGSAWKAAKEVPSELVNLAVPLLVGTGTVATDIAGYTGEIINPFVWTGKQPAIYGQKFLSDEKAIIAARAGTAEQFATMGNKMAEAGTSLGDRLLEKLGWITKEQAEDNAIRRYAFDADYNNYVRRNPSTLARFADQASLYTGMVANSPGAHAIDAAYKTFGPSVDQILSDHPEFNGDRQKAKDYQDHITLNLTNKTMEAWKDYENNHPIDPNVEALAGLIGPGANPFSVGFEAATLSKAAYSSIAKGLREAGKTDAQINAMYAAAAADKSKKLAENLAKASQVPGWAKVSGKLADIQDKFSNWAATQVEANPKIIKFAPYVGAGGVGAAIGAIQNPEHPIEGAITDLLKSEGFMLGWKLPRVVSDIGIGKAQSAGGVKGIAESAATRPEASWATKFLLSPEIKGMKVPPKAWDTVGRNLYEWGRAGVDIVPLTVAMNMMNSADADESAKAFSQGALFVGAGKVMGKFLGTDPYTARKNKEREDRDILKTFEQLSPESQTTINDLSDWNHVVVNQQQMVARSQNKFNQISAEKGATSPEAQIAATELKSHQDMLREVSSASAATRIEFNRQFKLALNNAHETLNGSLRTGNRNASIEVMTSDQIADRLIQNNNIPIQYQPTVRALVHSEMAMGRGVQFDAGGGINLPAGADPAIFNNQTKLVFDKFKPTAIVNADKLGLRQILNGESAIEALNHEVGHLLYRNQEYRDANKDAESVLFGIEFKGIDGKVDKVHPGIFSENDLFDLYGNRYMKDRSPEAQRGLARAAGLWDEKTQTLDRNATVNYIKEEILADVAANTLRKNLIPGKGGMIHHIMNWAAVRSRSNMVAHAIHNVLGLGARDPFDQAYSPALKMKFDPETMQATQNAIKAMRDLNGAVSFANEPDTQPLMTRAQMMSDRNLLERYGKDSGLVKTQIQGTVIDSKGNTIGKPVVIENPLAATGSWFADNDGKIKQSRGYGPLPDELKGMTLPPGASIHVDSQILYKADGKTPYLNESRDVKKLVKARANAIRDALEGTDDVGEPGRFSAASSDGLHFSGTFTDKQIQAIKEIPDNILPLSIKEKMLAINDLIKNGGGDMMDIDYSTHVDKNGRYVSTAPQIRTIVPLNMHLSKDGNFYVTTVSHDVLLRKLDLWSERMKARLNLWDGDKGKFYDQFVKEYLPNIPKKINDVALDADPAISKQKRDIFNDFMNVVRNDTRHFNEDRTTIPLKRGEKNKQFDNPVRSFRLDAIMDMAPHNGEKLPINYRGLLENWLPAEEEKTGEFYSQLDSTLNSKMPNKASAAQIAGILNGGAVKKDEIRFSGIMDRLPEWEQQYPQGIPKSVVQDYLKSEGSVKFEDVMLGGIVKGPSLDRLNRISLDSFGLVYNDLEPSQKAEVDDETKDYTHVARLTKFNRGDLVVPGGQYYREVVLTMPQGSNIDQIIQELYPNKKYSELDILQRNNVNAQLRQKSQDYTSTHFSDIPNYVAHMRLDDRDDAEGNPGVFIQEFQNDRNLAARKAGGYQDAKSKDIATEKEINRFYNGKGSMSDSEWASLSQRVQNELDNRNKPTEAPFDDPNKYTVALFKRALADAIQRGKKWVGWTGSDIQKDRYDLSKKVNEINYRRNATGSYSVSATSVNGNEIDLVKNGSIKDIEDAAGKEIARMIQAGEGDPYVDSDGEVYESDKTIKGKDIKVGGTWAEKLYDQTAVNAIGKYVKSLGSGSVEQSELKGSNNVATSALQERLNELIDLEQDSLYQSYLERVIYKLEQGKSVDEALYNISSSYQKIIRNIIEESQTSENEKYWKVNITPEMERVVREGGQANFLPSSDKDEKERIENATYTNLKTGKVKDGATHLIANPNAPKDDIDREGPAYGFRTSSGRVVDRQEAFKIAQDVGQLIEPKDENQKFHYDRGVLHSGMFEGKPTTMPFNGKIVSENRDPALQKAAQALRLATDPQEQKRLAAEYQEMVKERMPSYDLPAVPKPMSEEVMRDAIQGKTRKDKVGVANQILKQGDMVGSRIDIKASEKGNYVITLHDPRTSMTEGGAGSPIAHESTVHLKNVQFGSNASDALDIAAGRSKGTIATIEGEWQKTSPEEAYKIANDYLNDPEWRQIGMNPVRGSQFRIRATGEPIASADEVIQIGKFVLAKNPKVAEGADIAERMTTKTGQKFLPSDKLTEQDEKSDREEIKAREALKNGFYVDATGVVYPGSIIGAHKGKKQRIINLPWLPHPPKELMEDIPWKSLPKVPFSFNKASIMDLSDYDASFDGAVLGQGYINGSDRKILGVPFLYNGDQLFLTTGEELAKISKEYSPTGGYYSVSGEDPNSMFSQIKNGEAIKTSQNESFLENPNQYYVLESSNFDAPKVDYVSVREISNEQEKSIKAGELPTEETQNYQGINFLPSVDKDKGYAEEMDRKMPNGPKTLTYFSGGGLMEAGLQGLINPQYAVEYDPQIAAAYRAAHGDHMLEADITKVDPSQFKDVDYFHASPVCKNFSALKAKSQGGEESDLDVRSARAVSRVLKMHKPRFFTLENVKDYKGSDAYENIKRTLKNLGYNFDEAVYNAYDYGAPTDRKRLLLRATTEGELPPVRKVQGKSWYSVVKDLIDDLPEAPIRGKTDPEVNYLYDALRKDGIDPMNVPEPILFPGGRLRGVFDYRMSDEPAFTFKATPGNVDRILMPGGRLLRVTARAKARMSGLPDSYKLPNNENLGIKIIGNGIPADLVRNVFGPMFEKEGGSRFLPIDEEYQKAGTEEEKKAIIDQAAKDAGYTTFGYKAMIGHYPNISGNGPEDFYPVTFMAQDKQIAHVFEGSDKPVREVATDAQNLFDYRNPKDLAGLEKYLREMGVDEYNRQKHIADGSNGIEENLRHYFDSIDQVLAFAKEGNWGVLETPVVKKYIAEQGHEGFFVNEEFQSRSTEPNIAVFDPVRIKSIESETWDGSKLIMPSERFNTRKNDVRYLADNEEEPSLGLQILKGEKDAEGLGKNPTVFQIAKWFQDRYNAPIDYRNATKEDAKRLAMHLVSEIQHAYKLHPEAAGWYDENIKLAMDVMRELDSDLAKKENDFVLKALIAVTSDGNAVDNQFTQAWDEYQHWKKTGKFSGDFVSGTRIPNIKGNIQAIGHIVDKLGTEGAINWLTKKGTVFELKKSAVEDLGWTKEEADGIASGELQSSIVPYAAVFGPKLGSFFNNLYGDFSTTTMDRWFMRTIGRLTGMQVKEIPKADLQKSRSRIQDAFSELTPEERKKIGINQSSVQGSNIDENAKKISRYFSLKTNRTGISKQMDTFRKAINNHAKLTEPIVEAPLTGNHREWIRSVIDQVQEQLKSQGINLENADLQALLWYAEKELYEKLGYRSRERADDYASAAAAVYERQAGKPSGVYANSTGRVGRVGRSTESMELGRKDE